MVAMNGRFVDDSDRGTPADVETIVIERTIGTRFTDKGQAHFANALNAGVPNIILLHTVTKDEPVPTQAEKFLWQVDSYPGDFILAARGSQVRVFVETCAALGHTVQELDKAVTINDRSVSPKGDTPGARARRANDAKPARRADPAA